MAQQIMTVRGPVDPQVLGVIDAHSHLWIDRVPGADESAPVLNDAAAIESELRAFRAAGGSAIVDCQPYKAGRDANRLRQLSGASGVHVIACTGFHLRRYYADDNAPLWSMTTEAAAAFLLDELRQGTTESRGTDAVVYPGFIKIAAEATLEASPLHLFEAAAAAAKASGCAIEMHAERGAAIEEFLALFLAQGMTADKLVFCHVDKRADFGLHREMAQAGVLLEYDTFLRAKYDPERGVWPLLFQMVEVGLAQHVALATDMAGGEWWAQIGGGPGPAAFITHIQARLIDAGLDETV
ncbi:MAG: hypothetical protein JNJ61_17140, partial [Anaerolineae bacterium]|nr:hypothetical protein [Anaerolineae bacterium]